MDELTVEQRARLQALQDQVVAELAAMPVIGDVKPGLTEKMVAETALRMGIPVRAVRQDGESVILELETPRGVG